MKISCSLYSEWIAAVRTALSTAGYDHSTLNDQDCAIRWQAWKRRSVPARARRIERRSGFVCPAHLQQGLADLEGAIGTGADIWPWQSKRIDRPQIEDGLFNDYRVTHFHVGVGTEPSGYVNRTGELLFAVVNASTVFEIGIYHHGDWYELDLLDIIDAQWPHLLDPVTIHAIDVANCPKTRDEVKALRQAHVLSIIRLKSGRIVAPLGGGVATDGTSTEAVSSADRWASLLRAGERVIVDDIYDQVRAGTLAARDYDVHLHATDDEIAGIVDGVAKWILWKRV